MLTKSEQREHVIQALRVATTELEGAEEAERDARREHTRCLNAVNKAKKAYDKAKMALDECFPAQRGL